MREDCDMTSGHSLALSRTNWVPYGGSAKLELAVVLLAVAVGVTILGFRLRLPVQLRRPSRPVVIALVITWACAIPTFFVCVAIYAQQLQHDHLLGHVGRVGDPIAPVTFTAVVVTFIVIFVLSPDRSTRALSAAIAAIAAPMVFEFPFDLLVMARTYPPVEPQPGWFRVLFFAPLFIIEFTTLAFLALTPMVKLARSTFFALALMFVVFAVWGLEGLHYPLAPAPFALNVLSKLLAFAVICTLFLPQRRRRGQRAAEVGLSNQGGLLSDA
jgi:hypothetical protein